MSNSPTIILKITFSETHEINECLGQDQKDEMNSEGSEELRSIGSKKMA